MPALLALAAALLRGGSLRHLAALPFRGRPAPLPVWGSSATSYPSIVPAGGATSTASATSSSPPAVPRCSTAQRAGPMRIRCKEHPPPAGGGRRAAEDWRAASVFRLPPDYR